MTLTLCISLRSLRIQSTSGWRTDMRSQPSFQDIACGCMWSLLSPDNAICFWGTSLVSSWLDPENKNPCICLKSHSTRQGRWWKSLCGGAAHEHENLYVEAWPTTKHTKSVQGAKKSAELSGLERVGISSSSLPPT